MAAMPQVVLDAWATRVEPYVFTTVGPDAIPNSVYVICAKPLGEDRFLIVNNRFHKTLENIQAGSPGSLLFYAKDNRSFQLKGTVDYHTSGRIYADMKAWLDPKFPGLGAVVLAIEQVYSGAENLL